ncbi:hypothetical protein [Flavobacterium alkalisoli]|uniref:hypothetical protein n=1 Tax=Flavobacterium alkalisoli TaxID=2602769 RepID=UPI003A8CECA6
MIKEYFDISGFTVIKDDFISFELPFEAQAEKLYEDMFQAGIDNLLLDIGWYGNSVTLEGKFILLVIEDCNWEVPLYKASANEITGLKTEISKALEFVRRKIQ